MADPLSYAICKKPLDENSEYVYVQEGNVISIIIFRNKGYYYTCTDAYTQNIHTHTPLSQTWLLNTIPGIHTDRDFCLPGHHTNTPSAYHYGHIQELSMSWILPTNLCSPLWPQPPHQSPLPLSPRPENLPFIHTRILQTLTSHPHQSMPRPTLSLVQLEPMMGGFILSSTPDFHDFVRSGIPVLN